MSDDPRNYVLERAWPGLTTRGRTLQEIFTEYGAEPLIEMVNWKKIGTAWPGVKQNIERFLSLPEIEQAGREAVKAIKKKRRGSRKDAKPQSARGSGTNWAQAQRQMELGF